MFSWNPKTFPQALRTMLALAVSLWVLDMIMQTAFERPPQQSPEWEAPPPVLYGRE